MGKVVKCVTAVCVLGLGASAAAGQMVFNFVNSVSSPVTAQMLTGLNEAGALWSSQFIDPITVNINVSAGTLGAGIIAHTDTFYDPYTYSQVHTALLSDKRSAADLSSTSTLQAGPAISMLINHTKNNPNADKSAVYFDTGLGGPGEAGPENNSTIRMSTANAKALKLADGDSALSDANIKFSSGVSYDFDRSNNINGGQIDFVGVAAHEIGHMLGFVSGVDVLEGNADLKFDNELKFVTPLDLFRFSERSIVSGDGGGLGVNDWSADGVTKYFSIDGGLTQMAEFSTGPTYEDSHWKLGAGLGIMDPTALAGQLLIISNNDISALDVIGYDQVPEPSTAVSVGTMLMAAMVMSRRRGRRTAV